MEGWEGMFSYPSLGGSLWCRRMAVAPAGGGCPAAAPCRSHCTGAVFLILLPQSPLHGRLSSSFCSPRACWRGAVQHPSNPRLCVPAPTSNALFPVYVDLCTPTVTQECIGDMEFLLKEDEWDPMHLFFEGCNKNSSWNVRKRLI